MALQSYAQMMLPTPYLPKKPYWGGALALGDDGLPHHPVSSYSCASKAPVPSILPVKKEVPGTQDGCV